MGMFFEVQTLRSDEYALGLCQVKGVECTALQVWKPKMVVVGGWWLVSKMDGKIRGNVYGWEDMLWLGVDAEVLQYEFEDYA